MNDFTQKPAASSFLPIGLLALSSLVLLTWNLIIVTNQHSNSKNILAQQEKQISQSIETEAKVKAMMTDLISLARTDADAETIVKRYGIAFTPTQAGGGARKP